MKQKYILYVMNVGVKIIKMGRYEVIKYFWEELNAYTLNNHSFEDGFKQLVNASIERALIRNQHKGKLISEILLTKKKKPKCPSIHCNCERCTEITAIQGM